MDGVNIEGCEGPNSKYVKLVSGDGHEFIIKREYAVVSKTIRGMMTGPGECKEDETNVLTFREISSGVLRMVCLYFAYKIKYKNCSSEIPEFPMEVSMAFELVIAADYFAGGEQDM